MNEYLKILVRSYAVETSTIDTCLTRLNPGIFPASRGFFCSIQELNYHMLIYSDVYKSPK